MSVEKAKVAQAFALFLRLLQAGRIGAEEQELFRAYNDGEVREVLEDIFERQADVKILRTANALYVTPSVDNRMFGYTNEQLRQAMGLRDNKELYLAYFLILGLLAMFYNSDDQTARSREFVPLEVLEEYITGQVERVAAADPEDVATLESDLEFNLSAVAAVWLDLPPYDDTLQHLARGRNNRISFMLRVLRFLEDEGLVGVLEQREIRPTEKLDHVVTRYYFNDRRKERVLALVKGPLPLLPADGEVGSGAAH